MNTHPVETAIPIPYTEIAAFCERHHIVKMWLFGSVLRDDFSAESDVDVLVEFDPGHVPGWEFFGAWPEELEAIFGRPVDLGTPDSLSKYIRSKVMRSARVIYERAG
jgi:predicted nucleotidyltransferase